MTDPTSAVTTQRRAPAAPATLTVAGLTVRYGGVCAVEDLGFTVQAGESVGIIGSNGAGKTSTMRAVMGLVPRRADRMSYGDLDLISAPARSRVRHGIAYVPEGRHVFPGLSVERNLDLGAFTVRSNQAVVAARDDVYGMFPVLGEMRRRLAGALSGGQQQMLSIGRALMSRPSILMLDEPSMGLSPRLVGEIGATLTELRASGISMLIVEQNAKLTFAATDRCLVMENSRAVLDGPSTELANDPAIRRIYLGL